METVLIHCDASLKGGGRALIAWVIAPPPNEHVSAQFKQQKSFARIPRSPRKEFIQEAEAYAILRSLFDVPRDSKVKVCSDNISVIQRLEGLSLPFPQADTERIINSIEGLVDRKNLSVTYKWIPRRDNLAGHVIERVKRIWYKQIQRKIREGFVEHIILEPEMTIYEEDVGEYHQTEAEKEQEPGAFYELPDIL